MSYSALPNYGQDLMQGGDISRTWYQFFADVWKGKPAGAIGTITPSGSPFTYQATQKGFMVISGGTVSLVQFTRDGVTLVNVGFTSGIVPLGQGDSVIVTYSGAPTMTWIPR